MSPALRACLAARLLPSRRLDQTADAILGEGGEKIAEMAELRSRRYIRVLEWRPRVSLQEAPICSVGEDQKQHLELASDIAGAFKQQL